MGQHKLHKKCVQDVHNRLKSSHQCHKEYPLFRDGGNVHFIDTVGFPHADKQHFKPIAVECESGSSASQRESNKRDLEEFKRRYPEAEIFQVGNADEIDFEKLKRNNNALFRQPLKPIIPFKQPVKNYTFQPWKRKF